MKNNTLKFLLFVCFSITSLSSYAVDNRYKSIMWDVLMPPDYDISVLEEKIINSYSDVDLIADEAKANELDEKLKRLGESAPVVDKLAQQEIKIPGFVVPLEMEQNKVRSFLLVPYYGACIHVPPPPSNQIIHVTAKPFDLKSMYDPVWVYGKMNIEQTDSEYAVASYQIDAVKIEDYEMPNP